MSVDFIFELESKVEKLINAYASLKSETANTSSAIATKNARIKELEDENLVLAQEIEDLKTTVTDRQEKLDVAAKRVSEIIQKLEAVS